MNTKNTSNAFEASLSFGFKPMSTDYSISASDAVIEKYAGISMYQPTIDNVELFIRKYTLNELSGTDGVKSLDISVVPTKFDTLKPDYLKDAQGVVSIKIENVNLELPFLILDEEFIPFDIISLDKQRIPYSRENLRKVIAGIIMQKRTAHAIPEFEPYKKLDKPVNPASSIGFLGDVLKIQEQHAFRTTSGGNMYVTASESLDQALEKLAEMKPITSDEWKALENMIHDKVVEGEVAKLEKQAEVIKGSNDEKMYMIFNRVKEIPFVDANTLPHGTIVAFPEVCEHSIMMNKGIILDDYMDMAGYNPKKIKVIVSQDSRMKILEDYDKFLCIKIDPAGFRLPARGLDVLSQGDVFVAFDGNKALVPSVVESISERQFKNSGEVGYVDSSHYINQDEYRHSPATGHGGVKIFRINPIYKNEQMMSMFSDDGVDRSRILEDNYESIKLVTLKGLKFGEVPYNEFIKKKAHELGVNEMLMMGVAPHYDVVSKHRLGMKNYKTEGNVVFCTDEDTKIIRIKGLIKHHMRNKADLELMANSNFHEFEVTASESEEDFVKEAGVEEMCKTTDLGGARLPDSPMPSYWLYGTDQHLDKKAGVIGGGMLGLVGGSIAGMLAGSKIADMKHPAIPEIIALREKLEKEKKALNDLTAMHVNDDFYDKVYELTEKHVPDEMTVGATRAWIHDSLNGVSKTASIKSTLVTTGIVGIPVGIHAARMAFSAQKDHNLDPNFWSDALEGTIKEKQILEKSIQDSNGRIPAHIIDRHITPAAFADSNGEGFEYNSYVHDDMTNYLSGHGVDINKITMGDYRKLMDHYEHIGSFDVHPSEILNKTAGAIMKAVKNQASRFTAKNGGLRDALQTVVAKKEGTTAAIKDWKAFQAKELANGGKINKSFNYLGTDIKGKGLEDLKGLQIQSRTPSKSIGNGNKTITASKFTNIKHASEFNGMEKLAANEYIELRSVNKEKGTYDLKISHLDRNKKLVKSVVRVYKAVPYNQVREILKAVGYGVPKVSEILQKARFNNYAKYELPSDATPDALTGGQMMGPIKNSMNKIKNAIYDSNISDAVAAEVIGALMAGAVLGAGGSKPVYDAVSKFATEAGALSCEFEKIAIEKSSQSAKDVAKAMLVASKFNEKVASVVSGKAQYFKLNDVVDDILESRFALEKMASDLIDLKINQYKGEVLINPGYVQAAVKNLDHMFKLASCLDKYAEKIQADAPKSVDLMSPPNRTPDNADYDKYRDTSAENITKQYENKEA